MNVSYLRRIFGLGLGFVLVGQASMVKAMFASPEEVPVERLLKTAESVARRQPASAEAHYTLARIHYLAFSRDTNTAPAFSHERSGNVALAPSWMIRQNWWSAQYGHAQEKARREIGVEVNPDHRDERFWSTVRKYHQQLSKEDWRPPRLKMGERAEHAAKALDEFQKALQFAPNNPLYLLGFASLTDEVLAWKWKEKPEKLPADLEKLTLASAREGFLLAHELALQKDGQLEWRPAAGIESLVSWEAGQGYLRLSEVESRIGNPAVKKARQKISESLQRLEKLPMGPVTPIVFSLQAVKQLAVLLNTQATVEFDLRGYGPRARWPWLQPDAGLLVWDPQRAGRIKDASQLFGGYSFQIFRANGYDALAALDENSDGELRGEELRGIRVWFDRDGNGMSAPDEVHDLDELGIVALATRATGQDGVHPMNSAGVIFADGRTLPSWDWMVAPHDNPSDASH